MTTNRLNNLFRSDGDVDDLRVYLQSGTVPDGVAAAWRYRKRATGFALVGDKIKYGTLTLVAPRDHVDILGAMYHAEDNSGLGRGVVAFYKGVTQRYIGITRQMCSEYLSKQGSYQMSRPIVHRTNKAIVAKYPNQVWATDLIDFSHFLKHNKGWRYVATTIDVFSRKIWLEKLKYKEAVNTTAAFKRVCTRAGVTPKQILCDNGTEYKGEFEQWCKDSDIIVRHTIPNTPSSNGICERANAEVRKLARAIMLRDESLVWHTLLPDIEKNKNGSFSSAIKASPDQVWSPGHEKLPDRRLPAEILDQNPKLKAQKTILDNAKKAITQFRSKEYKVGDIVRVKMTALFANIRALIKNPGNTKNLIVTFSPILFRVKRVIRPHGLLERNRYVLVNHQDLELATPNGGSKQFYSGDLSLADEDANFDVGLTMNRALELNKVERSTRDVAF